MIITKLIGGIGKQMFQYAAGRRLAHSLSVDLKLDISWFEKYQLRKYALAAFNIVEHFASPEEVLSLTNENRHMVARLAKRVLPAFLLASPTHVKERYSHFDNSILSLPDNVSLNGYWQSGKYFKDIEELIRKEFTLKSPPEGKNLELALRIRNCKSVSLHIRRGDYVLNPIAMKSHGVCSSEYFHIAIQKMAEQIAEPHFLSFRMMRDGQRITSVFLSLLRLLNTMDLKKPMKICG